MTQNNSKKKKRYINPFCFLTSFYDARSLFFRSKESYTVRISKVNFFGQLQLCLKFSTARCCQEFAILTDLKKVNPVIGPLLHRRDSSSKSSSIFI